MFPTDTRQRIRAAYQEWSGLPNSQLEFEEVTSRTGITDHDTHPLNFNIMPSWGDAPGYATMTRSRSNDREITYGVSWLNKNWDWTRNRMDVPSRQADVQTIQVHEIGHPTGFGHPPPRCTPSVARPDCDPTTVMSWLWLGLKRSLTSHDKQFMADKY